MVILNGIKESSPDTLDRADVGIPGKYILMISRFSEAKDHTTLIQAIPFITDKNVKVAFAGDGPTLQAMKDLAVATGVSDRCLFLGDRKDAGNLIRHSVLGVQASNWEGFGLTAVEFMSQGKPVALSMTDALMDIAGDSCPFFQNKDPRDLARQINRLLSDDAYYADTKARCLERARYFSIERVANDHSRLYRNLLKGPD